MPTARGGRVGRVGREENSREREKETTRTETQHELLLLLLPLLHCAARWADVCISAVVSLLWPPGPLARRRASRRCWPKPPLSPPTGRCNEKLGSTDVLVYASPCTALGRAVNPSQPILCTLALAQPGPLEASKPHLAILTTSVLVKQSTLPLPPAPSPSPLAPS